MLIRNAKHKALKAMLKGDDAPKGLDAAVAKKVRLQLSAIQAASNVYEVGTVEGWKLHELKPYRPGTWSLWVTGNYRLTFRVDPKTGEAFDLDYEDYH